MDSRHFDVLTRAMSLARSRRGLLRGTLGAALAAVLSRDASAARKEKVTLCHKPGTADQATIEVPEPAVRAHLAHGDTLGTCPPDVCPFLARVDPGPPTVAFFEFQDTACGLSALEVLRTDNADTIVPPFTPGTTNPIAVRSTKIDQVQPSQVTIRTIDGCGNVDICEVEF